MSLVGQQANQFSDFGDAPPFPPEDTRQFDSERKLGRLFYGTRKNLLRVLYPFPKSPIIPKPDQVSRLLVVQLERLGDLVLTEPTLRALRFLYPNAERTLVANSTAEQLFAGTGWGEIKSREFLEDSSIENYDLLVDLTGRVEVKLARKLADSGIQHRIGFNRGGSGVFQTVAVPWPEITTQMSQVYFKLAGALGAEENDFIPSLPHGPDRKERGFVLWESYGVKRPVLLFPGAHFAEQRWAAKNFIKVGALLKQNSIEVAVVSGPDEIELGDQVASALDIPNVKSPSITELMDLIASSKVMVVNNTGPLHLACALGVPTVSTMGPTIPWRWWPVSTAPSVVFRGGSTTAIGNIDLIDPVEVSTATLALYDQNE